MISWKKHENCDEAHPGSERVSWHLRITDTNSEFDTEAKRLSRNNIVTVIKLSRPWGSDLQFGNF